MLKPLDKERAGVHFDARALELSVLESPISVFARFWVKACGGTRAETSR